MRLEYSPWLKARDLAQQETGMPVDFSDMGSKLVLISGTILFMLYAVMLPRYIGIAKIWFALLLLARISNPKKTQTTADRL